MDMINEFKVKYDYLRGSKPMLPRAEFISFWSRDTEDKDLIRMGDEIWRVFDLDKDSFMSVCFLHVFLSLFSRSSCFSLFSTIA